MTRSEQISVKKDTHISIVYRNYKKIIESEFLKDLSYAPFNKVEYVEYPNDALKIWYNLFINEILNKHALWGLIWFDGLRLCIHFHIILGSLDSFNMLL
jgi:hypothetical protein